VVEGSDVKAVAVPYCLGTLRLPSSLASTTHPRLAIQRTEPKHMAENLCGCPLLKTTDGARILSRWTPNTNIHINQRLSRSLISRD
jgi:hypothetical protein